MITHFANAPVSAWAKANLIQGMCWTKDPKTGKEYVFIGQAQRGGSGDVEDAIFHRHELVGDKLLFRDTMILRKGGHPQSFHVRISVLGKPWIWAGVEQYTASRRTGSKLARFPYVKGTKTTAMKGFTYIEHTVGNTIAAVAGPYSSGPDKIYVRRAQTLTETYTEHVEMNLMRGIWKPLRSVTVKRGAGTYQSACANPLEIVRVNGKTEQKHWLYRLDWAGHQVSRTDITAVKAPTGPNTSSEPEGVAHIRGTLAFAKRFNSVTRRVYALFAVR